jgi:WD40 repeat protein
MLAVTSDQGLQLWSAEGNSLLFSFAVSNAVSGQTDDPKFMRGIDATGNDLVVGCSNGHVLVFDCSTGLQTGSFPLLHTLTTESNAVQSLGASATTLAVGDDHGNLFVYLVQEAYRQSNIVFRGTGSPITSLVVCEDVVVAGYTTGHIRLFRTDDVNELAIEITAHTRAVTGLAIQPSTQLVASVSADQYVHVWSIPTFRSKANSSVNCVFTDMIENHMCTGVAFMGETRLCVSSYDEEEVFFFSRA